MRANTYKIKERVMDKSNERLVWIDYAKTILIVLVVLGHATGRFNGYIYQFHVAAFFCISGMLYKKKKGLIAEIINSFLRLLVPLIVVFLVFAVFIFLSVKVNIYDYYGLYEYIGLKQLIIKFFIYGQQYIDALGATWFLIVLFGVEVFQHILIHFNPSRYINLISGIVAYFLSFRLMEIGYQKHTIDLILLAFAYYQTGYFLKKAVMWTKSRKNYIAWFASLFIITTMGLLYFKMIHPMYMDIVSRTFLDKYMNYVAALNGTVWVISISVILEKRNRILDKLSNWISRNTLGIMMFHFVFFKLCYVILFALGRIPLQDVKRLTPQENVGIEYWPFLVIVAVLGSTFCWWGLNKNDTIRGILGQDKKVNSRLTQLVSGVEDKTVSLFWESYVGRFLKEFKNTVKENRSLYLWVLLLLLVCTSAIPIANSAVMCNDELQTRFWGQQGALPLFQNYYTASILQGRALSIVTTSVNFYIEFCHSSHLWRGMVSVLVLIADSGLIARVLYKVSKNKRLSYIYIGLFWACMSLSYENTVPNAFVAFLGIPVALFFASVNIMIDCYKTTKDSKSRRVIAMFLLALSLCSYEGMITLMPIYLIIAFIYRDKELGIIKGTAKNVIIPFIVSLGYLITYVIVGKIVVSGYNGNKMTFVSFGQSFEIVKNLLKSGVPGYYSFWSPKYKYLRSAYGRGDHIDIIKNFTNIRVLCISCIILSIIFLAKVEKKTRGDWRKVITAIGVVFVQAAIVTLPISISEMYQNNVGERGGFIGIPTSYLVYINIVLICSLLIEFIFTTIIKGQGIAVVGILLIMFISQIQADNTFYSNANRETFKTIENMEVLLQSDVFKEELNGQEIFAPKLYETKNALGIHEGYWTCFADSKGINCRFVTDNPNAIYKLYVVDDGCINIVGVDKGWIVSLQRINNRIIANDISGNGVVLECGDGITSSNGSIWYTYELE